MRQADIQTDREKWREREREREREAGEREQRAESKVGLLVQLTPKQAVSLGASSFVWILS